MILVPLNLLNHRRLLVTYLKPPKHESFVKVLETMDYFNSVVNALTTRQILVGGDRFKISWFTKSNTALPFDLYKYELKSVELGLRLSSDQTSIGLNCFQKITLYQQTNLNFTRKQN